MIVGNWDYSKAKYLLYRIEIPRELNYKEEKEFLKLVADQFDVNSDNETEILRDVLSEWECVYKIKSIKDILDIDEDFNPEKHEINVCEDCGKKQENIYYSNLYQPEIFCIHEFALGDWVDEDYLPEASFSTISLSTKTILSSGEVRDNLELEEEGALKLYLGEIKQDRVAIINPYTGLVYAVVNDSQVCYPLDWYFDESKRSFFNMNDKEQHCPPPQI